MTNKRIYLRSGRNEVYLDSYIIDDPLRRNRRRPAVLICPGGGYECCSSREAEPIALAFNAAGFHAFVLYYTLKAVFPAALKDLSDSVCILRDNANPWLIDSDKIIVCGFSAGGHLAASLGVFWNIEPKIKRADDKNRPNGLILGYPVITAGEFRHEGTIQNITDNRTNLMEQVSLENHVSSDCPPTFIWHTFTDDVVPVENSICFASALAEKKISTELHIFPSGGHGLSLSNLWVAESEDRIVPEVQQWIDMAIRWVNNL